MSYAFHDIKHIVEPYLDDLPAHSARQEDHYEHLKAIFLRCRHYNIRLNPHKCIFCVETGWLLGLIISKDGIKIDPLKVQAIIDLPPPSTLLQLQSLQGKTNFLCWFIHNYVEISKGFTRLLKKDIPFLWYEEAQCSFEALKEALANAPLLYHPNYTRDFTLYLAASHATICMVLAQEVDDHQEHMVYYLSKGLSGPEWNYSHVEKLALALVI